jgi:hypothetical protein
MPLLTDKPQASTVDSFRRKVREALVKRGCPPERLESEVEKVMQAGRGLKIDVAKIVAGP